MLKGKKVFVSGGAGVIGTSLVEKLMNTGARIFVGDLKPRPSDWPPEIRYRQGDLIYITQRELHDFEPEYVFHLAAAFERSVETCDFWEENYHHNVSLSHHLMTLLKDSPCLRKVVFASSYLVYDSDLYTFDKPAENSVRLKESDRILPRNLCGAAKLFHETELRFLASFSESEIVSARIFRSYGKNSRDVISRWIRMLLREESLEVFNEEGLFDYIFADEVAEGLLRLSAPGITGVVNLGNDNARRVREVVRVLRDHFPEMKKKESESGIKYEASQADMHLCRKLTRWTPQKQLEDAIPEMIRFEISGPGSGSEYQSPYILVTSLSRKIPLLRELRKALNKLSDKGRIFGGDVDEMCIGRHFVDGFWKMPYTSALKTDTLIDFCKQNSISVIIPTRDGELLWFAEHRNELSENGISVMISSIEGVRACVDKLKFYKELKSPGFYIIPTAGEISRIDADSYVVKERYGAGSRQIALNVSREYALKYARNLEEPIFQPYVPGREYSIDVYMTQEGRPKGAVVRSRDLILGGESQITTTVRNEELERLCFVIAERLELRGHLIFQAILDEKNQIHVTECNCRFGGASCLSVAAGLDSFYWFLLESQGQDISEYPFLRTRKELRQIRYAEDRIEELP